MLKDYGIEGIYIVHAKEGYEMHEQRINEIFGKLNLEYEFVSDGDISNFNFGVLQKYFCNSINNKLSAGVLSCTLNHIMCYERLIKNNNRFALIFENDPFFLGDFLNKIEKVAIEATNLEPGFIISLENTTLQFPDFRKIKKDKYLYEAFSGRCAGAYLIDLKGAKDILENVKTEKCCDVIDLWHNTLINNKIIRMYWAHPPLVEQGSHNGLLSSTISSKNKSMVRRLSWNAQKFYKMYIYRWFK